MKWSVGFKALLVGGALVVAGVIVAIVAPAAAAVGGVIAIAGIAAGGVGYIYDQGETLKAQIAQQQINDSFQKQINSLQQQINPQPTPTPTPDRKSTRLNSSH